MQNRNTSSRYTPSSAEAPIRPSLAKASTIRLNLPYKSGLNSLLDCPQPLHLHPSLLLTPSPPPNRPPNYAPLLSPHPSHLPLSSFPHLVLLKRHQDTIHKVPPRMVRNLEQGFPKRRWTDTPLTHIMTSLMERRTCYQGEVCDRCALEGRFEVCAIEVVAGIEEGGEGSTVFFG